MQYPLSIKIPVVYI